MGGGGIDALVSQNLRARWAEAGGVVAGENVCVEDPVVGKEDGRAAAMEVGGV